MEHFRLTAPCPAASLPSLAGLRDFDGTEIRGVALPGAPLAGYLAYCDRLPRPQAGDASCSAIVLAPAALVEDLRRIYPAAALVAADDPRARFIDALAWLQERDLLEPTSLLPRPFAVSPDARIGAGAVIEPGVCIEAGVRVGSGAVIRSGTWLRAGAAIGENSVVGSVGINAYVGNDGVRRGFPHVAGVIVGEGASVGAAAVVVRGILNSTVIGARSIVGNLCNIGHGVELGEDVWISAGTMVGGHTRIGAKATIALGCAIRDNISIGADANVGMGSVVTKNVQPGKSVFGNPARTFAALNTGPAR
jgi:UDP-3-O-[3-hydroxymyristoyl] glucosamine N-acyltransferase